MTRSACRAALKHAGWRGEDMPRVPELSVVLADDDFIRRLNRERRGHDRPTNVLAFPVLTGAELGALIKRSNAGAGPEAPILLGDIVVSHETAAREAGERQIPLADHLAHLIVHGVLHLHGYDHIDNDRAEVMEAIEAGVLGGLGIPDPYQPAARSEGAAP